jgi:hypothetical protein
MRKGAYTSRFNLTNQTLSYFTQEDLNQPRNQVAERLRRRFQGEDISLFEAEVKEEEAAASTAELEIHREVKEEESTAELEIHREVKEEESTAELEIHREVKEEESTAELEIHRGNAEALDTHRQTTATMEILGAVSEKEATVANQQQQNSVNTDPQEYEGNTHGGILIKKLRDVCTLTRDEVLKCPKHGDKGGVYCPECGWRVVHHVQASTSMSGIEKVHADDRDKNRNKWKADWEHLENTYNATAENRSGITRSIKEQLESGGLTPLLYMMQVVLMYDLTSTDRYYLSWAIIQTCWTNESSHMLKAFNFIVGRKRETGFFESHGKALLEATLPCMPNETLSPQTEARVLHASKNAEVTAGGEAVFSNQRLALPQSFKPISPATIYGGETRLAVLSDGNGGHYADATSLEPVIYEIVNRVTILEKQGQRVDYSQIGQILTQALKDNRGSQTRWQRDYGYSEQGGGTGRGGRGQGGRGRGGRGRGGYPNYQINASGAPDEAEQKSTPLAQEATSMSRQLSTAVTRNF